MKESKRRSTISMDVASMLQEVAKEKSLDKKDRINIKVFLQDFEKFNQVKKYLSENKEIYGFQIADVFREGLQVLKEKYQFPDVEENNILHTFGGRRGGTQPLRLLSEEEQQRIATKSTTVRLPIDVLREYNNYKTYKVKHNTDISTAELFKELLQSVVNKYN